jgi:hypothetical protein
VNADCYEGDWDKAACHYVYLSNVLPTKGLAWDKSHPLFSHLLAPFGACVTVHVPASTHNKLAPTSIDVIFLSVCIDSKVWHFWDGT